MGGCANEKIGSGLVETEPLRVVGDHPLRAIGDARRTDEELVLVGFSAGNRERSRLFRMLSHGEHK